MSNLFFQTVPTAQFGESPKGFVSRIAYFHGNPTIRDLHQMIDVPYNRLSYDTDSKAFETLIAKLSALMKVSAYELFTCFSLPDFIAVDSHRSIRDIRINHPRVCPSCVKDEAENYIHHDWLHAHYTHCQKHDVALLNCCPNCNVDFSSQWVSDVFEGCSNCGYRWEDIKVNVSSIPEYQKMAMTLTGQSLNVYLAQLYQAALMIMRPFDINIEPLKRLPEGINYEEVFRLAFALIFCDAFQQAFRAIRKAVWLKAAPHITEVSLDFDETLMRFDELVSFKSNVSYADLPAVKQYSQALPSKLVGISEKVAPTLITKEQTAKLLSLKDDDVMNLVEHNLLHPLDTGAHQWYFDLADVDTFLVIINSVATEPYCEDINKIDLISVSHLCDLNSCGFGETLTFILEGNIEISRSVESKRIQLSDFSVNRADVIEYFESNFSQSLNDLLTKNDLKKLCYLSDGELAVFIKHLSLSGLSLGSRKQVFESKSLIGLFENNILLNRWAKLNQVKIKDVHCYLKNYGINPSDDFLWREDIYLYDKTEKLEKMLRQFLYECGYYKGASALFLSLKYKRTISPTDFIIFY